MDSKLKDKINEMCDLFISRINGMESDARLVMLIDNTFRSAAQEVAESHYHSLSRGNRL